MNELSYLLEDMAALVREMGADGLFYGAMALALLLLLFAIRRGTESRVAGMNRAYKKIVKAGIPDWQRPYTLIATRDHWDELPEFFLMELASRLMDKETVIAFIALAETHGLERQVIPGLARNDAGTAMRELSGQLTLVARSLKGKESDALQSFALMIDPENCWANYAVAADCYRAKRYDEAEPLLEQAIDLFKGRLEGAERVDPRALQKDAEGGVVPLGREEMWQFFKRAQRMYRDCRQKLGAEAA